MRAGGGSRKGRSGKRGGGNVRGQRCVARGGGSEETERERLRAREFVPSW